MSRVMQIGASDDLFDKARRAIHDALAAGQQPLKWLMGREVYAKVTRDRTNAYFDTLFGYPFEVVKPTPRRPSAPPDLLELDTF